ncbi:gamma-glutamyltranspeptidase 1 [Elysia marginata]|uniref:Gamma-glutamyltranspeptidase 1 n=1 Tax=Elysia marginata TaxID=1093978 RepID=A0AAV4JH89_9GAST|nr:gamma-glutamyltranspeptidase 1 [Elysia marginata]
MASGVPGEVLGLWEVHRRFGKLPWADVVRPSVKLCQDGVPLRKAVYDAVSTRLVSEKMKKDFAYYFDENGNVKPVGSLIKMPLLAKTFQTIQDDPASFYNGSLAEDIVLDLQDEGGIFTVDDLKNYKLRWTAPTVLSLPGGYKLYSIPAPGSGPVLSYILNILAGYNMSPANFADDESKILTYHRIVEAFKFAYGKRTELGDEEFVNIADHVKNMTMLEFGEATRALIDDSKTHEPAYYNPSAAITDDQGTTHLSVLDGQGNAVSITSTINHYFGSKVKGNRTGIVFNNEMNDFSVPNTTNYFGLPASPANFIAPGKRPQSSMSPAIVWDTNNNKVRMISGASGGSKITTAVAMNILEVLWLGRPLPESLDAPRVHHQLFPHYVQLEEGFSKKLEEGLKAKGHDIGKPSGISVIQAIDVTDDGIVGSADFRKGGEPRGL